MLDTSWSLASAGCFGGFLTSWNSSLDSTSMIVDFTMGSGFDDFFFGFLFCSSSEAGSAMHFCFSDWFSGLGSSTSSSSDDDEDEDDEEDCGLLFCLRDWLSSLPSSCSPSSSDDSDCGLRFHFRD